MNNFDLKQNFKLVVYGGALSLIIAIASYGAYLKYQAPEGAAESSYLTGDNFGILIEFQQKKVTFLQISAQVESILQSATSSVPDIVPASGVGRPNPFTP